MGIFDELTTTTINGWGPTKPNSDVGDGPYAHSSKHQNKAGDTRGFSSGAGLFRGQIDETPGTNLDLVNANLNVGGWRGVDGKTNYGIEGNQSLLKLGMDPGVCGGPWGYDLSLLSGGGGAVMNDSTLSLGGGAELFGLAGQHGTSDPKSDTDHFSRAGLSAGPSIGGRAHYGDADGDGVREIGFGADIGPASFDMKSEWLGQAWNWMTK